MQRRAPFTGPRHLALLPLLWLTACVATSASTNTPCERASDCADDQTCDDGVCVDDSGGGRPRADAGTPGDDADDDAATDDGAVDTGLDEGSGDGDPDAAPQDDADADDTATDAGGGPTTCSEPLAACTPATPDTVSGAGPGFYCAPTATGGVCLAACSFAFNTQGCDGSTVCVPVDADGGEVLVCAPSDCDDFTQGAAQCSDGQCIEFAPDVGLCFGAGTAVTGAACRTNSVNPADNCDSNSFCDTETDTGTSGTCRALCDFWAGEVCGRDLTCTFLTTGTGFCDTFTAGAPLTECATPGDSCGERGQCFTFGTDGNFCASFCRRGVPADCADEPGTVCNWNALVNTTDVGLCLPGCTTDAQCNTGETCGGGVCSRACSIDSDCQGSDVCLDGTCKPDPA